MVCFSAPMENAIAALTGGGWVIYRDLRLPNPRPRPFKPAPEMQLISM
jgi:hypothetical protein